MSEQNLKPIVDKPLIKVELEEQLPEVYPGEVLLQVVKTGEYFKVNEATYRRSYTNTKKYIVKKKISKT